MSVGAAHMGQGRLVETRVASKYQTCVTCSELPSYIGTMVDIGEQFVSGLIHIHKVYIVSHVINKIVIDCSLISVLL